MNNIGKKIIFALTIFALAFFTFYSYKIISNRYFQSENKIEIKNDQPDVKTDEKSEDFSSKNSENTQTENQSGDIQQEIDPELKKLEEEEEATEEEAGSKNEEKDDAFANVTIKDCQNSCDNYTDKDELEYCQEFCGLITQKEQSGDCADLEGLEADYCLKDLAVSKKDYKICDKIGDAGILRVCLNRVTEDIIDSQK